MKLKHFLLLTILVLSLTGCMKNSKDTAYTGSIEADQIDISSEISGTLSKLFIQEGQNIKKGEKIAQIDTTSLNIKLKEAQAQLNSSQAGLKETKNGSRAEEISKARANLEAISALLEGAKSKYDYNIKNLNDLKSLYESEGVSQKSVEDAQALVDSSDSNYKNLQKQYEANKAALDLLLKGATSEKIKMSQSQVDLAASNIELLQYQISKGDIFSPIDGVVQTINFDENELIPNGGNMVSILDLNNQYVKIYISQKQLHKISLNQELNLTNDSLKDKKIKGKVIYISSEAEFTPKNVESKESKEEMVFEVKIKIMDNLDFLKPGMLVDVKLGDDK